MSKNLTFLDVALNENELRALGLITVHWGTLEMLVEGLLGITAQRLNAQLPENDDGSFNRMLKRLRILILQASGNTNTINEIVKILNSVGAIQQERHRVTHAMWARWEDHNDEAGNAVAFMGQSKRGKSFQWTITEKRMLALARKIYKARNDLMKITALLGSLEPALPHKPG